MYDLRGRIRDEHGGILFIPPLRRGGKEEGYGLPCSA